MSFVIKRLNSVFNSSNIHWLVLFLSFFFAGKANAQCTMVVMRHGHGVHNLKGIRNSTNEPRIDLTSRGVAEVHNSAVQFREQGKEENIDLMNLSVYSSPLIRAVQTASIFLETLKDENAMQIEVPSLKDTKIIEDRKPLDEIVRKQTQAYGLGEREIEQLIRERQWRACDNMSRWNFFCRVTQIERSYAIQARVEKFLEMALSECHQEDREKVILVVTHDGVAKYIDQALDPRRNSSRSFNTAEVRVYKAIKFFQARTSVESMCGITYLKKLFRNSLCRGIDLKKVDSD